MKQQRISCCTSYPGHDGCFAVFFFFLPVVCPPTLNLGQEGCLSLRQQGLSRRTPWRKGYLRPKDVLSYYLPYSTGYCLFHFLPWKLKPRLVLPHFIYLGYMVCLAALLTLATRVVLSHYLPWPQRFSCRTTYLGHKGCLVALLTLATRVVLPHSWSPRTRRLWEEGRPRSLPACTSVNK